jgi:hypothetical protein
VPGTFTSGSAVEGPSICRVRNTLPRCLWRLRPGSDDALRVLALRDEERWAEDRTARHTAGREIAERKRLGSLSTAAAIGHRDFLDQDLPRAAEHRSGLLGHAARTLPLWCRRLLRRLAGAGVAATLLRLAGTALRRLAGLGRLACLALATSSATSAPVGGLRRSRSRGGSLAVGFGLGLGLRLGRSLGSRRRLLG